VFDLRRVIARRLSVVGAAAAGAALGALVWLAAGGVSSADGRLRDDQIRLAALKLDGPQDWPVPELAAAAIAHPLFALTTGPGAVADVVVRLVGFSLSPRRAAALISVNGGEASWIERGKSRDGVTVVEVLPSKVVVETPLGRKEAAFGASDAIAVADPTSSDQSGVPAGVRLPPEPASAPGTP
jgi:hypothetical protein